MDRSSTGEKSDAGTEPGTEVEISKYLLKNE